MDESALHRLAEDGVAALLPTLLHDTAEYCWDRGETTGDARFCSLWRTLDSIEALIGDDAVLNSVLDPINALLAAGLPEVLEAPTAEVGALLARSLRERIELVALA